MAGASVTARVTARVMAGAGTGGTSHEIPRYTMRQWDGIDKRDQAYPRPVTGGMSHGSS